MFAHNRALSSPHKWGGYKFVSQNLWHLLEGMQKNIMFLYFLRFLIAFTCMYEKLEIEMHIFST